MADWAKEMNKLADIGMLANEWPDEAGRAAYMAGFHAAQTMIFESTGRAVKLHGGLQGEFARLV